MNNTSRTRNYFESVHQYIFDGDKYLEWNADTAALNEILSLSELKICTVGNEYKDKEHLSDSYMWSGDGTNKYQKKFISHE